MALPANSTWWKPQKGLAWQIQYSGTIDTSVNVSVFNLDLFDTTNQTIAALKKKKVKIICYLSAGSYENWRPDKANFPKSVIGKPLDGWPGENWLDVSKWNLLGPIMTKRIQLAKARGCDAVDPDNVDGYQNDSGFTISTQQQLTYIKNLANVAHSLGLAISLKNNLDQVTSLIPFVDFAVNEECVRYKECDRYSAFVKAGKPVYAIEYQGGAAATCKVQKANGLDGLYKHLNLDAYRVACK